MPMVITQALAEIATIGKRLQKKQQMVVGNAFRLDSLRDPFEKDGGTRTVLTAELQSIRDLQSRIVTLRGAINRCNSTIRVSVGDVTKTVEDWLIWRREVAPLQRQFLTVLNKTILDARQAALKSGGTVKTADQSDGSKADILVNIDEKALYAQIEEHENIMGTLDGLLSMHNATTVLEGVI